MTTEVQVIEKHGLLTRWTHWVNFPLLTLMVWSGILIYWANPAYIPFPNSVAVPLGVDHRLARGMQWHFFLVWPFVINGLLFVITLLATGQWREFIPRRGAFRDALLYTWWDLGLSRREPPPFAGKFNPAQKLSYFGVLILAIGAVVSGFAIYKPVQLGWLTFLLGGYEGARLVHFVCMVLIVLFFVAHVVQVARSGWNNFRSMVAGYELDER